MHIIPFKGSHRLPLNAKKAGIATAAVEKQLHQMTLKGYIQRKETDGSLRIFATTSI